MRPPMHVPGDGGSKHRYRDSHQKNNQNRNHLRATNVTTPVSRRPTLQGTTLLNLQYRDGSRLRDQNEDTKQKAQYLYTATQHLTQHRDRNASDNSMNTTPADLQITAETEVLQLPPNSWNRSTYTRWNWKENETRCLPSTRRCGRNSRTDKNWRTTTSKLTTSRRTEVTRFGQPRLAPATRPRHTRP